MSSPSTTVLSFPGPLTESLAMPTAPVADILYLDLNQVTNINSSGVRKWIDWIRPLKSKIILRNTPKCIVDQINMVGDFLPAGTLIESFYVPHFSEDTGEEITLLYEINKDFSPKQIPQKKKIMDTQGAAMDWDIVPEKYFRFISKYT